MTDDDVKRGFMKRIKRRQALAGLLGKKTANKLISVGLDSETKVERASDEDLAAADLNDFQLSVIARYIKRGY